MSQFKFLPYAFPVASSPVCNIVFEMVCEIACGIARGMVCFIACLMTCGVPLNAQSTLSPPQQHSVSGPSVANDPARNLDEQATLAAAIEKTKAHQDAEALKLFSQVLAADPKNAQVNLLASGAAIESLQMEIALEYAQRAQQLDPADWKVHLTLLVADAGTGKVKERDQERDLVRGFHADGKHPDATQSNGFMVDYFALKDYRIRAVEYFAPIGKPHFAYRFLVYNQDRKQIWTVALESDDLDQTSWASAHKELAATGAREYSLEGYGADAHTIYRNYSGKPSYDDLKAQVVKVLSEQPLPQKP